MLAKFLVYFPPSLAEVSHAYVVHGTSGDEWGELIGGKGTIGLQAAVPKKPHKRPLSLSLTPIHDMCNFCFPWCGLCYFGVQMLLCIWIPCKVQGLSVLNVKYVSKDKERQKKLQVCPYVVVAVGINVSMWQETHTVSILKQNTFTSVRNTQQHSKEFSILLNTNFIIDWNVKKLHVLILYPYHLQACIQTMSKKEKYQIVFQQIQLYQKYKVFVSWAL